MRLASGFRILAASYWPVGLNFLISDFMKLLQVFAGKVREVPHGTGTVATAIFKTALSGSVHVGTLGLEPDEQADPRFHGGPNKAVYAYPTEHYTYWQQQRPDLEFPPGVFGENLATEGLDERTMCVGDTYKIGSTILQVRGIRVPCFKLGIRLGDPSIIKDFLNADRTGIYFSVEQEGSVQAGDAIERLATDGYGLTVYELSRAYHAEKDNRDLVEKAANAPNLSVDWRQSFKEQLEKLS